MQEWIWMLEAWAAEHEADAEVARVTGDRKKEQQHREAARACRGEVDELQEGLL